MKKVQIGDALDIKASTWNNFIDAANFVKGIQSNQNGSVIRNGLYNGVVFIKNMTSNNYGQFSAMVLTDIAIKPNKNEAEFKGKVPVFIGSKMTNDLENHPYAVLLEPIEIGKIGRALLLGITPAKVNIQDSEDQFAIPSVDSNNGALESSDSGVARILWKAGNSGEQWCMLQLGGAGSGGGSDKVVLCRVTGGTITNGYNVSVYGDGINEPITESGILFVPELALNSEIPSGSLILGHRTFLKITGGNE